MGAGTPESGFWPRVWARDLCSQDTSMSTKDSAAENSAATTGTRRIETGRLTKALDEGMEIDAHAPAMYEVTNGDDVTRIVDVETGTCECADHQYRGDEYVCKHILAAAVHHVFVDGVTTQLVARVADRVTGRGCTHGHESFCEGPFGVGALPCDECVEGTRTGIWTVWTTLVGDSEVRR